MRGRKSQEGFDMDPLEIVDCRASGEAVFRGFPRKMDWYRNG